MLARLAKALIQAIRSRDQFAKHRQHVPALVRNEASTQNRIPVTKIKGFPVPRSDYGLCEERWQRVPVLGGNCAVMEVMIAGSSLHQGAPRDLATLLTNKVN